MHSALVVDEPHRQAPWFDVATQSCLGHYLVVAFSSIHTVAWGAVGAAASTWKRSPAAGTRDRGSLRGGRGTGGPRADISAASRDVARAAVAAALGTGGTTGPGAARDVPAGKRVAGSANWPCTARTITHQYPCSFKLCSSRSMGVVQVWRALLPVYAKVREVCALKGKPRSLTCVDVSARSVPSVPRASASSCVKAEICGETLGLRGCLATSARVLDVSLLLTTGLAAGAGPAAGVRAGSAVVPAAGCGTPLLDSLAPVAPLPESLGDVRGGCGACCAVGIVAGGCAVGCALVRVCSLEASVPEAGTCAAATAAPVGWSVERVGLLGGTAGLLVSDWKGPCVSTLRPGSVAKRCRRPTSSFSPRVLRVCDTEHTAGL